MTRNECQDFMDAMALVLEEQDIFYLVLKKYPLKKYGIITLLFTHM